MKQIEHQKSIGWFKLAEFVERGEKERALGVYKLLALSINDPAFSCQLEGDILLAFDDVLATNKYFQAAELYIKQGNINAAIGTLNHLVILTPDNLQAWQLLSDLYINYLLPKIMIHLRNLTNNNQINCAKDCIQELVTKCQQTNQNNFLQTIIPDIEKLNENLHKFILQAIK